MNKAHTNISWVNYPNTDTPINEANLNKMDSSIDMIDDRVIELDTTKATKTEVSTLISDIQYDESTGIFTFTRKNGGVITLDTKLEKLAINFKYDQTKEQLIITLDDGSEQIVDLSALITQYEFLDSDTIAFSVDGTGKVTAIVKEGSIEEKHLQPNYLADIKVEVAKANTSAENAATSEENAKASEKAAAESEKNASDSESAAATSEANAKDSELAALNSERNAADSESGAKSYSESASTSAETATTKAGEASESANSALESADIATTKADEANTSAGNAATSEKNAKSSEEASALSESNAATSEANAKVSETSVSENAQKAAESEAAAKSYSESAQENADIANNKASEATENAKIASEAADTASSKADESSESATSAANSATLAQSYAVGGTNSRNDEDTDNAKYYSEQSKEIYDNLIEAGNVTGVKGNAELDYRTGNVNITAEDIGASDSISYDKKTSQLQLKSGENVISVTEIVSGGGGNANIWNGTMDEYETAYSDGEIQDESVVNILGDYDVPDTKVNADTLSDHTADDFALKNHQHSYTDLLYKPIENGVLLDYPTSGKSLRNIYVSTEEPTDDIGDNGDLWIVYAESEDE